MNDSETFDKQVVLADAEKLVTDPTTSTAVLEFLAESLETKPNILMLLAQTHTQPGIIRRVARNIHTPEQALVLLADNMWTGMLVARNPAAGQQALEALFKDPRYNYLLVVHPNATAELLDRVAEGGVFLADISRHVNAGEHTLDMLAYDPWMRFLVAQNPSTGVVTLERMAHDPPLLGCLTENPNLPAHLLRMMFKTAVTSGELTVDLLQKLYNKGLRLPEREQNDIVAHYGTGYRKIFEDNKRILSGVKSNLSGQANIDHYR